MYTCDDTSADGLIENDICDEIDSFSHDCSDSPSIMTHAPNPTLELKPLRNSLKYVF